MTVACQNLNSQGTVLLVEDDLALQQYLREAMLGAGLEVAASASASAMIELVESRNFSHIVLDVRLPDGNGLDLIRHSRRCRPQARIVMISGYASFASVVVAMRAGAVDFLAKPFAADRLLQSLFLRQLPTPPASATPLHPDRVRWERINRTYEQSGRNLSRTARLLGLHRQTVARALARPPKEHLH